MVIKSNLLFVLLQIFQHSYSLIIKAELLATGAAAKIVRYIQLLLTELGFPHDSPIDIYEDNALTIMIVNS